MAIGLEIWKVVTNINDSLCDDHCSTSRATIDPLHCCKMSKRSSHQCSSHSYPSPSYLRLGCSIWAHLGMRQAATLKCQAMEKGNCGWMTVTHETSRKDWTVHTNLWNVSPPWSGLDLDVSFVSRNQRFCTSICPVHKKFFKHFARGFQIRTGIMSRQDRAYSLKLIHELLNLFELEWERQQENSNWLSAVMFCWYPLLEEWGDMYLADVKMKQIIPEWVGRGLVLLDMWSS